MFQLSVILPTHNPEPRMLKRVLDSLVAQTLDHSAWELILVDNSSKSPVRKTLDSLKLSIEARIVEEPRLGLTVARISGIKAATGEILVFIDDDNILDMKFLENALDLMIEHPEIGVAGGRIRGEFEVEPEPWLIPHLGNLAIRDFGDRPIRALIYNQIGPWEPCGAGMVIRASVASEYGRMAIRGTRNRLDRIGNTLRSCGDTDMARTASDMGLFMAYEPSLILTHVIPKARLNFRYFMRLSYTIQRDAWILYRIRGRHCALSLGRFWTCLIILPIKTLTYPPKRWLLHIVEQFGQLQGRRFRLPQEEQ